MPKEKDFQKMFNNWVKKNWLKGTAVFELKMAKTKSLPFKALRETQRLGLKLASEKGRKLVYKIADDSIGCKPFDSFCITGAPAYVVIMFYFAKQKEFVMIPIESFIKEMIISKRKSLTKKRAEEIGTVYKLD